MKRNVIEELGPGLIVLGFFVLLVLCGAGWEVTKWLMLIGALR